MRLLLILSLVVATPLMAQPATESGRQAQVEASLSPRFYSAGAAQPRYGIRERMAHYAIPGVSVAVINDGEIEWVQGYGVLEAGGAAPVTPESRFQAASISKPVAAITALRLVEAGALRLDDNVDGRLRSWQVPRVAPEARVTLRGLLSHTAGLTVSGFPGYAATETVPSLTGVLAGDGNTDAVRQDTTEGSAFRYSGGGYTVAQLLIEDVTQASFASVADREVLSRLGMTRSAFAQPLPEAWAPTTAVGHRDDGTVVPGRWHTYPELAAAGLWTTPTDLARFMLAVRSASRGERPEFLNSTTATLALTPVIGQYALGFGIGDAGDSLSFGHGGANEGYRAMAHIHMASGDGVIVMTNSDAGGALADEIRRSVASVYGFYVPAPETRETVAISQDALDRFVGHYPLDGEPETVIVERVGDHLRVTVPTYWDRGREMSATSPTEFVDMDDGATVTFEADGDAMRLVFLGWYRGTRAD